MLEHPYESPKGEESSRERRWGIIVAYVIFVPVIATAGLVLLLWLLMAMRGLPD